MKREFVMLAKTYQDQDISGWYASIKYDGQRAFWDGGVSRGLPKVNVPWANNDKDRRNHTCTGLWSRHGNVIYAPDWWLDKLPRGIMLDGELWMGRRTFQELRSTVGRYEPGEGWRRVEYRLVDVVSPNVFFQSGKFGECYIVEDVCRDWYARHGKDKGLFDYVPTFKEVVRRWGVLKNDIVIPTEQLVVDSESVLGLLDEETSRGGEGLVLRNPSSVWVPHRVTSLLKVKPHTEGVGIVVGWTSGIGKYDGMLGSVRVSWEGRVFSLSGFTDSERRVVDRGWCSAHCGELMPDWVQTQFPLGSRIHFKFRELSNDGTPKEARYDRWATSSSGGDSGTSAT